MAVSVDQSNNELSGLALATASVRLLAPGSAMVSVSPVDIAGTGVTQTSNIVISNLKDVDTSVPVPDGTKVALSAVNCASRFSNGFCVSSVGGDILPVGTVPDDGTTSPSSSSWKIFTVSGGEVRATYSATGLWANPGATNTATLHFVYGGETFDAMFVVTNVQMIRRFLVVQGRLNTPWTIIPGMTLSLR